jgi:chromosome segregation ATPase
MEVEEAEQRAQALSGENAKWQQAYQEATRSASDAQADLDNLQSRLDAALSSQSTLARDLEEQTAVVEQLTQLAADATLAALGPGASPACTCA